jgi:FolB domain-containing protein
MEKITISDLAVLYRIGVPDAERAKPQRLLVTIDLVGNFNQAAAGDDLAKTINYYDVCQWVIHFGTGREWKLLETLASQLADAILAQFNPAHIRIEIKKFIIPEARHIAYELQRDGNISSKPIGFKA